MNITRDIKAAAASLGFDQVGITTALPFDDAEPIFLDRIARGLYDDLDWFTASRAHTACTPKAHIATARSVIGLAMSYYSTKDVDLSRTGDPHGRISRYAWGPDYHGFVAERAEQLCDYMRRRHRATARPKACVDTSALAERAVARRAGVGWFGKNTMLLTTTHGSWVFLAEIVTDLDLEADAPLKKSCGSCRRCIPACPTGALDTPYELDARLCISLLTIELRGAIPRSLRSRMGTWLFGCDLCQEVCPVNRNVAGADQAYFESAGGIGPSPALLPLLQLDEREFRRRFRHSPIKRAGRNGLVRNACVALGNIGDPVAIGPLAATLIADVDRVVRSHAAWALGRFAEPEAGRLLRLAVKGEPEATVQAEIVAAIEHNDG